MVHNQNPDLMLRYENFTQCVFSVFTEEYLCFAPEHPDPLEVSSAPMKAWWRLKSSTQRQWPAVASSQQQRQNHGNQRVPAPAKFLQGTEGYPRPFGNDFPSTFSIIRVPLGREVTIDIDIGIYIYLFNSTKYL